MRQFQSCILHYFTFKQENELILLYLSVEMCATDFPFILFSTLIKVICILREGKIHISDFFYKNFIHYIPCIQWILHFNNFISFSIVRPTLFNFNRSPISYYNKNKCKFWIRKKFWIKNTRCFFTIDVWFLRIFFFHFVFWIIQNFLKIIF